MSKVEVDVSGDTINTAFVKALLESTLGDSIQKAVDRVGSEYSSRSVIDRAVDEAVRHSINALVRTRLNEPEMYDKLRQIVVEKLSDEVLQRVVGVLIDSMIERR